MEREGVIRYITKMGLVHISLLHSGNNVCISDICLLYDCVKLDSGFEQPGLVEELKKVELTHFKRHRVNFFRTMRPGEGCE